ncbi:MAG: hypothetical protein AAGD01_19340 [Acidobacteriota bacterium]
MIVENSIESPRAGIPAPEMAPELPTARLLALRSAGAPFGGSWDLQSDEFLDLARRWDELQDELPRRRDELVEALFQAVPGAESKGQRRRILKLKRDIFNGRRVQGLPADLPEHLRAPAEAYAALQQREAEHFDASRQEILAALRTNLLSLWQQPRFRAASTYSSSALAADLEANGLPEEEQFHSLDRGLYTFVERFRTKANPFHLFADLTLPPHLDKAEAGECEVVVDTSALYRLEERVLEELAGSDDLWLALRPSSDQSGERRFWVPTENGFRWAPAPQDEVSIRLLGLMEDRLKDGAPPVLRQREWVDREASASAAADVQDSEKAQEAARQVVRDGLAAGWLEIFWLDDFRQLDGALEQLPPEAKGLRQEAEQWRRLHLARCSESELAQLETEITELDGRCFVNRYRSSNLDAWTASMTAAQRVAADLAAVKPFFLPMSSGGGTTYGLQAYLADLLDHRGRESVALFELLPHYLRHSREIIQHYRPDVHRAQEERERIARWQQACGELSGHLDSKGLEDLRQQLPDSEDRSLCFTGPYDLASGVFYPGACFAGEGRFASRYLLHRESSLVSSSRESSEGGDAVLDVELVVAPRPNLNLHVRRFDIGCGFEPRYGMSYERWIPAEQVHLSLDEERSQVLYRLGADGPQIRFHYSGFLLAPYLPPQLQLLLAGHGDFFTNPFAGVDRTPTDGGIEHRPELRLETLCLRRPTWSFGGEALAELPREAGPLRYAAAVRRCFRQWTGSEEQRWYYRAPAAGGRRSHKPRFLDLGNPLSAYALRHTLDRLGNGQALHCSPMAPTPSGLLPIDGRGHTAEWMIEVGS